MESEVRSEVLIVDDDAAFCDRLAGALAIRGYAIKTAYTAGAARALASDNPPEFAVVELKIAGESGLKLISALIGLEPDIRIVVLTGYGSIASAVEAVKLGARDYLTKPADVNDLLRAFGVPRATPGGAASAAPLVLPAPASPPAADEAREVPSLARVEWEHITRVLADCGGNISQAARLLRMQRRSLQRKLAKYPVSK